MKKNERYDVTIEGLTSEGSGVAKIDGFAVFIPHTAVGDLARIKIVKVLSHYAYGIVEEILTPSADRISSDCDVFLQCGGCCYRHLTYEAELKAKEQQVFDAFSRIGHFDIMPEVIVGGESEQEYRNKAQFPIGLNSDQKAVIGFYASRSHRIIKCENCHLLPPVFNQIARDVVRFINKNRLKVYDEQTHRGVFRHIYLRRAEMTGEIMLCIVATVPSIPKQDDFISFMTTRYPEIKTIVVNVNLENTNVILGEKSIPIYGDGFITDTICDVQVQISSQAFYQVNRRQAERLYQKAISYAQLTGMETVLDLYCGIGTIGLSAASKAGMIVGVEVVPQAVEDAKQNAAMNGIQHARFLCADCKQAVQQLQKENIHPDVILLDPPRKGCDLEVLDTVAAFSPKRIVMISCNPATAARDCRLLEERGYHLQCYQPYDLFPRTKHVECVVLMTK
jgi:23S rRNA (uracil1939-C5)-methyltransferase